MREQLTGKDVQRLSIFIRDLYVLRTHDEFSTHLVAAIPSVTEGEFTSYNEFHSNGNDGIINQYEDQHPFGAHLQRTKGGSAKMLSDFLTMREFRQTPLYHEFYKPVQIPYLAVIALTVNSKTLWVTPRAQALLLEFGLKHRPGSDRLPSLLYEWVTERGRALRCSDEPAAPGTPLILTQGFDNYISGS